MNDRRFRHKLKKKLKERFPDELLFLTTKLNTADTVVSAKNASSYVLLDDTSCVVEAANTLMWTVTADILVPTIDDLLTTETELSDWWLCSWRSFLMKLKDNPSRNENIGWLIQSHSADLVHGVSRGDMNTAKHFLLALEVHITGLQLFLRYLFAKYNILQQSGWSCLAFAKLPSEVSCNRR